MHELTHPIELRDEELDFVAAGTGSCGGCNTHNENRQALIYLEDVNVLNNIAVASVGFSQVAA